MAHHTNSALNSEGDARPRSQVPDNISRRASACSYLVLFSAIATVYVFSDFTILWSYMYFPLEFSGNRLLLAATAVALCATITPTAFRPSVVILHAVLSLVIVPSSVLYACGGHSAWFFAVTLMGYLIILPFQTWEGWIPEFHGRWTDRELLLFGCLFCATCLAGIYLLSGFKNFNFDIWRVYEFRAVAKEELPGFFGYLIPPATKVFVPLMIVLGLYNRSWLWVFVGFLTGFFFFAFTSHKSAIFTPFAVTTLCFLFYQLHKNPTRFLICTAAVGIVLFGLSWLDFSRHDSNESSMVGTLFFRRVLMVPVMLNGLYIESFGTIFPYQLFSDNTFTLGMIDRTNTDSSPVLIGGYYFGREMNANTGFIGAGYAQAGLLAVLAYGAILGMYGALANVIARRQGSALVGSCLFMPIITMVASADLPTGMVTHGGFLALIVLAMRSPQQTEHTQPMPQLHS